MLETQKSVLKMMIAINNWKENVGKGNAMREIGVQMWIIQLKALNLTLNSSKFNLRVL